MIVNKHVQEYIDLYESGKVLFNKERIMLVEYLQEYIFPRDDIYFDDDMIDNFVSFAEKWYFPLEPFQKFLSAFVFLFHKEDGDVFYEQFLWLMAKGAGKNGLISAISHFLISPLHGVPSYNVSIVANSEKQAKISFHDIYDAIEGNKALEKQFYRTKVEILCNQTRSIVQYHTSNVNSKDGLRDGAVIYDEIHQYESQDVVNVFSSGLGKVRNAREFFIGTDGYVREGFLDGMKERALNILKGEELEDPLFPFICKIDEKEEADDFYMWEKAQPMFSRPMNSYARGLFKKVKTQYIQLKTNPSNRPEFMTKRMNFPEVDPSVVVAEWEDILATNRPFPDLEHRTAIGGLDYAQVKDFAAVGLLFKVDGEYVWKSHTFARKGFLDTTYLKAPIHYWEELGLLTIVDEPVINMQHIVDWFVEAREIYGLNTIVADSFRIDIVKKALEDEGFELEFIKNPRGIHSLLAPRVETMFANHNIIFEDNPLMRWYTNNVYVHVKKDGNKEYLKKDEDRRKTDGFQAFIHALYKADEILEDDEEFILDAIDF